MQIHIVNLLFSNPWSLYTRGISVQKWGGSNENNDKIALQKSARMIHPGCCHLDCWFVL